MKTKKTAIILFCGFLGTVFVAGPNLLKAQAPAGPLSQPQSQDPATRPKAKPKKEIPPRTTLAGAWKLNRDDSDDPRRKMNETSGKNGGNIGNGGGYPGGYPGGGYPGGGGPMGGGYPFPGAGGGMGGPSRRQGNGGGQEAEKNPKLLQMVQPAESLSFSLKETEVEATDDEQHRLVFYTDGRQLQKPADDGYKEIAAHWEGSRLVSDEKTPQGGKMSRTLELSSDGKQFYETFHIENNKSKTPLVIRYVYDMTGPEVQAGPDSDPDKPTMKRRPANTDSSSQ